METGTDAAVAFLKSVHPTRPWALTAIQPDRKGIETRTFAPEQWEAARAWIEKWNGKRNVYFHVNEPSGPLSKKAEKSDIKAAHYLHVDIDPRAGESLDEEQERIRRMVEEETGWPDHLPRPQVVLFSGGGYQCFWRLAESVPINGDIAAAEEFERYNKALELALGGDNCHNVDRIMRLPGTLNIPDAKKIKKGRVPVEARELFVREGAIRLDKVKPAPKVQQPDAVPKVSISGGVARLDDINALDEWGVPDQVKVIIVQGRTPDPEDMTEKQRRFSDSEWVFYAVCALLRCEVPDEVIYSLITDRSFGVSAHVLRQKNVERYAVRQIERGRVEVETGPLLLDPNDPLPSAREFISRTRPTLMHYNDDWLVHTGAAYTELEEATVRAELYHFLERAQAPGKEEPRPFKPTKAKVGNVMEALASVAHRRRDTFTPPCWLEGGDDPPASELLACANGLLHLRTGELHANSEDFFTRNALDFGYDVSAPAPEHWLAFLGSLWPKDRASIDTLQEMFGYLLLPDTSQQKIFMLVGPPRSGKGTIARVLIELVGRHNTGAPTLHSLGENFGLEPLLGKQLAVVSDLRLGRKTDHATLAENLLRISGEDMVTASRKYKRAWDGVLSIRFLIMTNQMPRFADSSGALANRFVPIIMTESFLGREKPGLVNDLLPELPSILNWAIVGWRRLQKRGHFELPETSRAATQQLIDLASPVTAFVRDRCVLQPTATVPKEELFAEWRNWCNANGDIPAGATSTFGSNLIAAMHGKVKVGKPRVGGKRVPAYVGIGLLAQEEEPETDDIPF